jgi:hypothetical protein
VLYDGSSGTSPQSQGWLSYFSVSNPFGSFATVTQNPTSVTVNTNATNSIYAGYSNYTALGSPVSGSFPLLDRNVGFSLRFTVQVNSQTNDGPNGANRAGLSIILLAQDNRGIELGFWENEIFAQDDDPLFVKAESASFNTTAGNIEYELVIFDSAYQLFKVGAGVAILTGSLRDYSAWPGSPPLPNPYTIGSYLFVGDNTTSARASFTLSNLTLVPEPSTLWLVGLLGAVMATRRR